MARTDAQVGSSAGDTSLLRAQLIAKLAYVITRSDGSFEEWSETLPNLIGVDPCDVPRTTRAWLYLLHPHDRPMVRAGAIEAEAKGVRTDLEYRLRRPDGNWIHIRQAMEPLGGRPHPDKNMRWFITLQDISEQKRTAEVLAEGEAGYWAIFEQVGVGVVHSDLNGRVLHVNRKFCELSGYSRDDVSTVNIRALTHPEDFEKSVAARAALLAEASVPYEREARLVRKDQSMLWAHITTSLIRSAGGEPRHFVSIVHDISEGKVAQQALADSEQRFRQITENIREVFWLTDQNKSQILYVSPAYEQIWGRKADALYVSPRDWVEAIHPDDRERVMAAAQSKQVVGAYDEEYRIVRPNGTVRWIRDRAFPVRDGHREVIRVAGVAEDITERKHAADALAESERRFSEILGKVQLVSLILDRDGQISYCNDYLLKLSGWTHEEVSARNWFDVFIPPEIAQDLKGVFASLLADLPAAWHYQNEILTRSGGRRLIHWNNILLRSSTGDVIGTASIGEDITERVATQQELSRHRDDLQRLVHERTAELLLAKNQAEAANRAKSQFLANMSHELRTPMHAILSFAEVGGRQVSSARIDPSKLGKYYERIEQSGQRLMRLLNDLLDLSKLEAGKMELSFAMGNLTALTKDVVSEFSELARAKNVDVRFHETQDDRYAWCDADRIRQVVRNLLSNAIKFTPAGGRVLIETSYIEGADSKPCQVRISVRDTGIGVPDDELNSIFDYFVQSSRTGRGAGGTGLGLAISRQILAQHGGSIEAINNEGAGATFSLQLPSDRPSAEGTIG